MKVLIACEESQTVCKEFRECGFEAYSCDILEPSGGHPEWHILGDVIPILDGGCVTTMDGRTHEIKKWDLIIAHPPCTYLTITGNRWFDVLKYGEKAKQRYAERYKSIVFFMYFALASCPHVAVENPIGVISTAYRKADQIIQPFMFGDAERKGTCLWLKNLPNLVPTDVVEPVVIKYKNGKGTDNPWHMRTIGMPKEERSRERSKTFPGIAKAMAEQWGNYILQEEQHEL
ncbi:MAG: hypothetical protein IIZ94_06735 [Prevotella sp.]|nr:hypothetical protein [Prevotella sp.]